jgi:hypothetical protein
MFKEGLTAISRKGVSRSRGRPSGLTDTQLHLRREQFVQIFESSWGDIEFGLQRCRKADDLIGVITPIAEPGSWVYGPLSIFCSESSESASANALRIIRAELRAIVEPYRLADEVTRNAYGQLQQLNRIFAQGPKKHRRVLKRAQKLKRKQYHKAVQQLSDLSKKLRELEKRLKGIEISFARQELLRFLKSKRYALTPLSLANAAAGLPDIGWRRSMRRCLKEQSKLANGLDYQIFKLISYIARTSNKKSEYTLVTSFRERLKSLPRRHQTVGAKLAETWWYLERALLQAYRSKPHRKALIGEVSKRYFKQTRSYSEVNAVLAEQAKLTFSK